jgi:mRNA deadenylase 3'-5' endonuclease subunit Ccr4
MKEDIKMTNVENLYDNNKSAFPLNIRKWVPKLNIDLSSNKYLRVLSYNILCDSLVSISTNIKESELNKMPFIKWEERRKKILEEISTLTPDIICLQELERDDYLISELGKMNFDVKLIFIKKFKFHNYFY